MDINIFGIIIAVQVIFLVIGMIWKDKLYSSMLDIFGGIFGIYATLSLAKSGVITELSNGNNVVVVSDNNGFNAVVILMIMFVIIMFVAAISKLAKRR